MRTFVRYLPILFLFSSLSQNIAFAFDITGDSLSIDKQLAVGTCQIAIRFIPNGSSRRAEIRLESGTGTAGIVAISGGTRIFRSQRVGGPAFTESLIESCGVTDAHVISQDGVLEFPAGTRMESEEELSVSFLASDTNGCPLEYTAILSGLMTTTASLTESPVAVSEPNLSACSLYYLVEAAEDIAGNINERIVTANQLNST